MWSSNTFKKFSDPQEPIKRHEKLKNPDNFWKASKSSNNSNLGKQNFVDLKDFPELRTITTTSTTFVKTTSTTTSTATKISNNNNNNNVNNSNNNKSSSNIHHNNRLDIVNKNSEVISIKPWSKVNKNTEVFSESFPALTDVKKFKEPEVNNSKEGTKLSEPSNLGAFQEILESKIKKKDSENIKTMIQPKRNPYKKKRSDPLYINLQDFKSKRKLKKKEHSISKQKLRNKEQLSGNYLDSSNPKRSKGKFREIKKIRLTSFKKSIIKERIIKQKIKESEIRAYFGDENINVIDSIDFKSEIKTYLSQLNEKKSKNLRGVNSKEIDKKNKQEVNNESLRTNVTKCTKEKKLPQVSSDGKIQFSAKFREYCDNIITKDLNNAVIELISELIKLQDRQFLRDPIKAKAKKRHVSGIREIKKHLFLKKVKMIIIAPNLEKIQMEGGIFDSISELKSMAVSQNVVYGFALNRYGLGRVTRKNVPVSAFAILNYEGIEGLYETALNHLLEAKNKFKELIEPKKIDIKNVNSQVIASLISAIQEDLNVSKDAQFEHD